MQRLQQIHHLNLPITHPVSYLHLLSSCMSLKFRLSFILREKGNLVFSQSFVGNNSLSIFCATLISIFIPSFFSIVVYAKSLDLWTEIS